MTGFGSQSMVAPLRRVIVKRPEEAFRSRDHINKEWKDLGYPRPPNLEDAVRHDQQFVALMKEAGGDGVYLPEDERTRLDYLYAHDRVRVTNRCAIVFQTGKVGRRGEGRNFSDAFKSWDVRILGII